MPESFRRGVIPALLLLLPASCRIPGESRPPGGRIYYDAYHCARHLWDRDNRRHRVNYHTVSGFHRFHRALRAEGFQVHVEDRRPFTREILDGYDMVYLGAQTYHARFMTEEERRVLLHWVRDGGGLFVEVEHTNAHYMADVFDRLVRALPIRSGRDSIADPDQRGPLSPTWVDMPISRVHPVTRGVREYRFYNGTRLITGHGVLFSSESSWADAWNPEDSPIHNGNKKRDRDELPGPHAGVAAFGYGKGRIVVIGDHNALANPNLYWGDHYRFAMNACSWLTGRPLDLEGRGIPAGASAEHSDLLVHVGNDPDVKYMTKEMGGFYGFYGQWTKEPHLRPWASAHLKRGYEALVLSAPTRAYSPEQLEIIAGYLARGRSVVYLMTAASVDSPAGRQLQERLGFRVQVHGTDHLPAGRTPFNTRGDESLLAGIFRMYVYRGTSRITCTGGRPLVRLTRGAYHIEEGAWKEERDRFDLLTEYRPQAGRGRLLLFGPMKIFNRRGLNHLYESADVVREQMAELVIRLADYAVGRR